jgi:hypothetical protein
MSADIPNFATLIEQAQAVNTDVASPFPAPGAGRVAFQPGRVPGAAEFDFEAKVSVFALPADSGEYEDVLNMVLRGEAIIRYEDRTFTKDGDFLVAVSYMVPRAPAAARAPDGDAGDREPVERHGRLA